MKNIWQKLRAGVLCAGILILTGCTEQVAEDNATEGTKIDLPADLLTTCRPEYFDYDDASIISGCKEFGGEPVCSYFEQTNDTGTEIKNQQYSTECHACRFYGETGEKKAGIVRYKSLGWTGGGCEGSK